jgi:biopolymer transport protein ExbD
MKIQLPAINVTPLIDILLVLLIIFMVISPLRPARFKTLVPEKPPERGDISPRTLVIEVAHDLSLRLIRGDTTIATGTISDPGVIASRLASEWRERKANRSWKLELENSFDVTPDERIERTVFVRAPRSVHYGEIAKVIDEIKGAGAQPIGLQTDLLID